MCILLQFSQQSCKKCVVISILPKRKLRLSEVKYLAQGQRTGRWKSLCGCVPDSRGPLPVPFLKRWETCQGKGQSGPLELLLWENSKIGSYHCFVVNFCQYPDISNLRALAPQGRWFYVDPVLVQLAATTKIPRTRWLTIHNRCLFLSILEAGKSKIQAPADSVSGEGPLLV